MLNYQKCLFFQENFSNVQLAFMPLRKIIWHCFLKIRKVPGSTNLSGPNHTLKFGNQFKSLIPEFHPVSPELPEPWFRGNQLSKKADKLIFKEMANPAVFLLLKSL